MSVKITHTKSKNVNSTRLAALADSCCGFSLGRLLCLLDSVLVKAGCHECILLHQLHHLTLSEVCTLVLLISRMTNTSRHCSALSHAIGPGVFLCGFAPNNGHIWGTHNGPRLFDLCFCCLGCGVAGRPDTTVICHQTTDPIRQPRRTTTSGPQPARPSQSAAATHLHCSHASPN